MASVFTFDPDPPRVASPWLEAETQSSTGPTPAEEAAFEPSSKPHFGGHGFTKLVAEPQEGSVEYKLHLLLRPRRRLSTSSTTLHISGSHQSRFWMTNTASESDTTPPPLPQMPAPTSQSRHNRLQNLTTQLLWRLQQSSPFHSSANSDLVVPTLFDQNNDRVMPSGPGKPLPGLEESQGALYEIGVSDDGTLVGLTEDELDESINTLGIMASSLGCRVDVLRRMTVGTCRWTEEIAESRKAVREIHEGLLWVAEAQVLPDIRSQRNNFPTAAVNPATKGISRTALPNQEPTLHTPEIEQLRISLTGNTTSGKSSLLGTLSTSTLDNGRGKSRLSLLKHRHEIASGVTSSIVTELIGYYRTGVLSGVNVVNFASGNISSWNDIHSICDSDRLVVLTDSAGHPRYRRTTVRGLLSWAPNWTICCVASDDDERDTGKTGATATSKEILGPMGAETDLSRSHLELCLALGLPLIVVITKLDLASSSGLREVLKKILTLLKAAGRHPAVLSSSAAGIESQDLQTIPDEDQREVTGLIAKIQQLGSAIVVPIILTSAVSGAGICKLHALLHQLPLQITNDPSSIEQKNVESAISPKGVFQIDEVFDSSQARTLTLLDGSKIVDGHILSGHLAHGTLGIGDTALVGPFNSDADVDSSVDHKVHLARSCPSFEESSSSFARAREPQRSTSGLLAGQGSLVHGDVTSKSVWRSIRVVSLRNLRLPVKQLLAGQVGTVGVTHNDGARVNDGGSNVPTSTAGRIRKGMVLICGLESAGIDLPSSYRHFSAVFQDSKVTSIAPGSSVVVYIASIRASAKILSLQNSNVSISSGDLFEFEDHTNDDVEEHAERQGEVEISFEFLASTEWFEMGSQVLVMPERADAGGVGLEGFVGKVTGGGS